MLRSFALAVLLISLPAFAAVHVEKVVIDTHVVERVLDASKRSVPTDVLRRVVLDDIEMLRGVRTDGTYDYAYYDRFEAERHSQSFSIAALKEGENETSEVKGAFIYKLILEVPGRRLLVARNRRIHVEGVEIDFIAQGKTTRSTHVVEIKEWLEPGTSRTIELPEIARQMTARVIARGDTETGYGNLIVTVVEARIIDDARSPFAAAVSAAKSLLRAVDGGDKAAMRNGAAAIRAALPSAPAVAPVASGMDRSELQRDLQMIQDLLTGTDAEKREGLERLHQLIRRVRSR